MSARFVGLSLVIDLVYKGRISLVIQFTVRSLSCERLYREVLVRDLAHFCLGSCIIVLGSYLCWFYTLVLALYLNPLLAACPKVSVT